MVEEFCAGVATSDAGGTVLVKTDDDKWWSVTVATGARTPIPKRGRDARCGRIQALGHEETLAREEVPGNTVAIPEVSVSKVFTRGTAPNIAIGYKRPGTAVAMVAGVTSGGKLVWKSEVPAETPLRSRLWGSDDVVLDDAVVALFYEYQEGPPALTVFDRATGNRVERAAPRARARIVHPVRARPDPRPSRRHDVRRHLHVRAAHGCAALDDRAHTGHPLIFDGCGSFTATLDGSNLDHLTSLSFGREGGTGFGTAPSA
ncbi:MAG: hypothetical protein NT062_28450 [Proteobacteria bacterium]|nr:hypothetical protein [Pseudomonadota bacterium]